jgi:hypothetical protein
MPQPAGTGNQAGRFRPLSNPPDREEPSTFNLENPALITSTRTSVTPRCEYCGNSLSFFEGEAYCDGCTSYTVAADLIDLARADDDNLIDLARDA